MRWSVNAARPFRTSERHALSVLTSVWKQMLNTLLGFCGRGQHKQEFPNANWLKVTVLLPAEENLWGCFVTASGFTSDQLSTDVWNWS